MGKETSKTDFIFSVVNIQLLVYLKLVAKNLHRILILSRISTYGGVFEKIFSGIEQRCLGMY